MLPLVASMAVRFLSLPLSLPLPLSLRAFILPKHACEYPHEMCVDPVLLDQGRRATDVALSYKRRPDIGVHPRKLVRVALVVARSLSLRVANERVVRL